MGPFLDLQVAAELDVRIDAPDPGVARDADPQPEGEGLTERGIAAVRAMVKNRILIDISHMHPDAIAETFKLLDDELDPNCEVPVVSTHAGYRFGEQEYMHDRDTVLDLHTAFTRCYDQGGFAAKIDYKRDPSIPLAEEDRRWVNDLLVQQKLR